MDINSCQVQVLSQCDHKVICERWNIKLFFNQINIIITQRNADINILHM
jgi:hypothetical protein